MKRRKVIALILIGVMVTAMFAGCGKKKSTGEWWDLRSAKEQKYNPEVTGVDSEFMGYEVLKGTYGKKGPEMEVTHYWSWYVENPQSTRQRIDIYVPKTATEKSPILHMVDNGGWTSNDYGYCAPEFDAKKGVFTPGNNTSANALNRGYIVVTNGARTYGMPSSGDGFAKSPATMADSKAAIRFLRANMGKDKAIEVGNPDLAFVTGWSGGGALSNILGASGNSTDYFACMYESGAYGVKWVGNVDYEKATIEEKVAKSSWENSGNDAYIGVCTWCAMDDFQMGEQALAWYSTEKRWAQDAEPLNKTPSVMRASNLMAEEYVDYVNKLGLKDENGNVLEATYTVKPNPDEGGIAGGSFLDATIKLLEADMNRALKLTKEGKNIDKDAEEFQVVDPLNAFWDMSYGMEIMQEHDHAKITNSVLINGEKPSEKLADPANIPDEPDVKILDRTQFALGISNIADKSGIFAFSSDVFGFVPYEPENYNELLDTAGLYGADDQPALPIHKTSWSYFCGDPAKYPRTGQKNTGLTWEEFMKTDEGKVVAMQLKTASSFPYLNSDKLDAYPYVVASGVSGNTECDTAHYWFGRFGNADQSNPFCMRTMLYYSLMNNPQVDFENCDLSLFVWSKPHTTDYENIFPYIDRVSELFLNQ